MAVDWSAIAVGGLAVTGGVISLSREWSARHGDRGRIKSDLEILKELPDDSTVKKQLMDYIDRSIEGLISNERVTRREPFGIGLALLFLSVTVWLTLQAVDGSILWWPFVFVGALFTLAGFATALPKVPRDERGRQIKEPTAN